MKKVSVIVPVYNGEKTIRKCVESIINQTYKNIEIILIDDGSKDNTHEILEQLKSQDNRIVVINQENKGASIARNAGIDYSSRRFYRICRFR